MCAKEEKNRKENRLMDMYMRNGVLEGIIVLF
jgi:hypothetical protein